jgi:hypothetical protein
MTNDMNHNRLLVVQDFVQNTVVTHAEFVETRQIARQWLQSILSIFAANQRIRLTMRRPTDLSNLASSRAASRIQM